MVLHFSFEGGGGFQSSTNKSPPTPPFSAGSWVNCSAPTWLARSHLGGVVGGAQFEHVEKSDHLTRDFCQHRLSKSFLRALRREGEGERERGSEKERGRKGGGRQRGREREEMGRKREGGERDELTGQSLRAVVSNHVPWRAESMQVFTPTNHYTSWFY